MVKTTIIEINGEEMENIKICFSCVHYIPSQKFQCNELNCYRKPTDNACDYHKKRSEVYPYLSKVKSTIISNGIYHIKIEVDNNYDFYLEA